MSLARCLGEATVLRHGCRNRAYRDLLAACRRPSQRAEPVLFMGHYTGHDVDIICITVTLAALLQVPCEQSGSGLNGKPVRL